MYKDAQKRPRTSTEHMMYIQFASGVQANAMFRNSHRRCSVKTSVLKNFLNFTGKQLYWSLFLIKLQACNFINKGLQHRCFPVKFAKFLITHLFWKTFTNGCFWKFIEVVLLTLTFPTRLFNMKHVKFYSSVYIRFIFPWNMGFTKTVFL